MKLLFRMVYIKIKIFCLVKCYYLLMSIEKIMKKFVNDLIKIIFLNFNLGWEVLKEWNLNVMINCY